MPADNPVEIRDKDLISRCRARYGSDFVFDIDPRDEMYQDHVTHAGEGDPVLDYFRVGEAVMEIVTEMSKKGGRKLSPGRSVLDFASGYGRFTRFLIQKTGRSTVSVSDIDRDAVDFCKKTFGVQGFYSAMYPEDCEIPARYDIIVVVSLFSHLSIDLWRQWMAKLYESLAEGGVLIFTTHGIGLLDTLKIETAHKVSEGFYFLHQSETRRLRIEDYGSAFVSDTFVKEYFKENHPGSPVRYFPERLLQFQDVYMVKKREHGPWYARLISFARSFAS
jgi:SAM-dependent methyltransferase